MTKREKMLLCISLTSAGVAGYLYYKYKIDVGALKHRVEEIKMLRNVNLEAGVFDAGISNIARRIDNKRCAMNRYLQGSNVDPHKLQAFKDEILELEVTLNYATNWKSKMIKD